MASGVVAVWPWAAMKAWYFAKASSADPLK
jgi:hypothetical protein